MTRFLNSKKDQFIAKLSELPSLEAKDNDLTIRSKFNFSYFDHTQAPSQSFDEWTKEQLRDLLIKIKEFTAKPLDYWRNERVGKGGLKIFATYGSFPNKSAFTKPKHVPHQAQWGRFRLGSKIRLIGFTIPTELHNTIHSETKEFYDKNTFYVVFLDRDHKFYLTEQA